MLTAYNYNKALEVIKEVKRILKIEMPRGNFVFVGVDNDYLYFNVVSKLHLTNEQEIKDICQKTRFIPLNVFQHMIYKGEFKISLNP